MGDLTEREIFDCLETNFRLAAEDAEKLATTPRRGPIYHEFRAKLELIGGACRQAAYWRQDSRWFQFDAWAHAVHQACGEWLRGIKPKDGGPRVKLAEGQLHPNFRAAANRLRVMHAIAIEFRDKATGKVGMILPVAQRAPHRDTVPVGWRQSSSGLLVKAA